MATLFELVAKLTMDSSEYDKGVDQAGGKLSGLGSKLKSGAGKIAKLSAGAIAGATSAVTAFGGTALKAGMDFDTAMSQVASTMGKTTDEISDLRDFAQKMGSETKFSATESAEALNYMALAGYDAKTSMDMLPTVLDLASAGAMDLASASDMVTDTQSALGLSLEETKTMVDEMAKASSKTNTSVSQLGDAMLTIGATARGVKGGTTELSAVLGVLADNGIKASEGGTHLRNAILSLQTPTKSGAEALAELGMTYADMYDEAGNMRALPEIFLQLQGAMEGMTQQSKDAIISGIFNKTDLASINALVGTSAERWKELDSEIGNATGSAKKMAETQLDNLAGDITIMKSALEGVQIALSDKLTPTFRTFVQATGDGLGTIGEKLRSGDLTGAVEKAGETIAKIASEALKKIPDLVKAGIALLKGLVSGLVKELPSVANDLFKAIPKLFESFGDLDLGFVDKLAEGIDQGLPKLLEKVIPMIVSLSDKIRENAGKLISAGLDLIVHLAQGIANSLPVLIENIPQIITNIANIIDENAPKLIVAGVKIIGILALGIIKAIPTLIANIPKIFEAFIAVWSALNWMNLGKTALTMIKNGFLALKTALPQALKNIAESAKNAFRSIDWRMVGANAVTLIKNGVVALAKLIPQALKNIGRVAMFTVKNINWLSVGKFIVQGIVKGITLVPGIIANALLKVVKTGYEKVKSYLGIASPSKLFRKEIGVNIGKGTALGIQDTFPQIARTMSDLDSMLAVPTATAGYSTPATADDVLSAMDSGYVVDVQDNGDTPRTIDATMEVNGVVFARLIYDMWQNEARRRGVNIEGVYA